MNPLTQVLQCLKHTSRSWNMIIVPDPRRFLPLKRLGQTGIREFRLKLQSGVDLEKFLFRNPSFGGTSNIGSGRATKSTNSKWIRILDSDLRNVNGQTLREVLVEVLNKFPSYELQSEEGSEAAIRDIERKLTSVASIEDEDKIAKVWK